MSDYQFWFIIGLLFGICGKLEDNINWRITFNLIGSVSVIWSLIILIVGK